MLKSVSDTLLARYRRARQAAHRSSELCCVWIYCKACIHFKGWDIGIMESFSSVSCSSWAKSSVSDYGYHLTLGHCPVFCGRMGALRHGALSSCWTGEQCWSLRCWPIAESKGLWQMVLSWKRPGADSLGRRSPGNVFSVGSALSRRLEERLTEVPSTLNNSVMMLTGHWRGNMLEVAYEK